MAKIPKTLNEVLKWTGIAMIGVGPLFTWLGFSAYKSQMLEYLLLGFITQGYPAITMMLIMLVLMYTPSLVYAGITLPIIGAAILLVLKIIVLATEGTENKVKEVFEIIGLGAVIAGAIMIGITVGIWADTIFLAVLLSAFGAQFIIFVFLFLSLPDLPWLIGIFLILGGFVITLICKILEYREPGI